MTEQTSSSLGVTLSASLHFHTQGPILLPLGKMETLQVLLVGAPASQCVYCGLHSSYVPVCISDAASVVYKPLERAALSALTMTSFVPTDVFPGKVFILKKCPFPTKKLLC